MRHIFIINPTSGIRDSKKVIPWIKEYFENENDYEIYVTEYEGHATEIANRYSVRDHVCIYSVGGDGTAYEVLNGLNDNVPMGLIPNGTGNDFHRSIYTEKFNLKEMLIKTIEGDIHMIDYGVANEHRFLNMFTVGLDAIIAKEAENLGIKNIIPNSLSYVYGVIKSLTKMPKIKFTFKYNGEIIEQDSLLFAVMNGQYYGGGFRPSPDAKLTDGLFNVLLIESVSVLTLARFILPYAKGQHKNIKQIQEFKLNSFILRADQKMTYTCDGEIFEDDYFVITMLEKRLPFKMPKGSVYDDSDRESKLHSWANSWWSSNSKF